MRTGRNHRHAIGRTDAWRGSSPGLSPALDAGSEKNGGLPYKRAAWANIRHESKHVKGPQRRRTHTAPGHSPAQQYNPKPGLARMQEHGIRTGQNEQSGGPQIHAPERP